MSSMINKMSMVEDTTNEGWVHQIVSRILKLVIYNFFMKLILFIYLYFVSNNIQFCEKKSWIRSIEICEIIWWVHFRPRSMTTTTTTPVEILRILQVIFNEIISSIKPKCPYRLSLDIQYTLVLRKPDLRKNFDLRKIVATTDFLVHKLFNLRKIFFQKAEKIGTFWWF